MTQEREQGGLPQIKAAINVASKVIFEKANENGTYSAVKRYREITSCTPWADCNLPEEAEEIRRKYGQDPLFNFTWNLLNLIQSE